MKELSVVIPVMNEVENIEPMIGAVSAALQGLDYEMVFVDDGSTDGTQKEIVRCATEQVRLIELRKNYGQSSNGTSTLPR